MPWIDMVSLSRGRDCLGFSDFKTNARLLVFPPSAHSYWASYVCNFYPFHFICFSLLFLQKQKPSGQRGSFLKVKYCFLMPLHFHFVHALKLSKMFHFWLSISAPGPNSALPTADLCKGHPAGSSGQGLWFACSNFLLEGFHKGKRWSEEEGGWSCWITN